MSQTAYDLASWIVMRIIFIPGVLEPSPPTDPQVPNVSLQEYLLHMATEIDNFIPVYRSDILTIPIEDDDGAAHDEFTEKLDDLLYRLIPALASWEDSYYFDEVFGKVWDYLEIRCHEENIRDE